MHALLAIEDFFLFLELSIFSAAKISLRRFNCRLYFALLLTDLLPTIYTTVRIHYLGELPHNWGVNIASQLQWVNVILEVVQEALIKPLYFCIGLTIGNARETENKVKSGLFVTFLVYLVCASVIAGAASPLTDWMAQDEKLISKTVDYVRLELIGIVISNLVEFFMVVFVLLNAQRHIYVILAIKMSLSIVLDSFFLSESIDVSLKLGVNGIAYTNITTATVTFIYATCVFCRMYGYCLGRPSFAWLREWSFVGLFSGLDSLIRNAAYLLMIIRMMNVVKKQGTYWLANSFVWSWLLLPFLSLSKLLIQDTSNTNDIMDHRVKTLAYYVIVSCIAAVWCVTIPGWKGFFDVVLNIEKINEVFRLATILAPFYMLYMLNTLMDSVFYGKGKTEMLAIQSIITNIVVYGIAFVLFKTDVFEPSLTKIAILFGAGITMDSFITFGLYYIFLRKVQFKL